MAKQRENPVVQIVPHNHRQRYKVHGCVCDLHQLEKCSCSVWLQLATHCSVLVQWSLVKEQLFNQVDASSQSMTGGKLRAKGKADGIQGR